MSRMSDGEIENQAVNAKQLADLLCLVVIYLPASSARTEEELSRLACSYGALADLCHRIERARRKKSNKRKAPSVSTQGLPHESAP